MTTSRQRAALGEFLDALVPRSRALGVEGIVVARVAHAQRLPASSRREAARIGAELTERYAR
ncbi:hypothetical protein GA0070607_0084 [Micromonospora coriariae]|uniref:Uncharacterized protein n=1 Tax=Micromonospora coriariae TaxID=285665 RepID=A0A1C4U384_9ACTN|nr:hypothetical protein [Micromonospora coriariae]SCE66141.1 hypothetical protein GA0070607_0084 [Micromonospora coriariae]